MLIDEPGKGFDPSAKEAALEALKCVAETGTAVLFATHDSQFITAAHTRLRIQNQLIQEVQRESPRFSDFYFSLGLVFRQPLRCHRKFRVGQLLLLLRWLW